jgi:beta-galactosidase/beta-glucuronidase
MQQMTRAGFQRRTKVNLVWLGTTLRMEARGQKLELRPGAGGVVAVYLRGVEELKREPVDFKEDPQKLVARWMPAIEAQKKIDEQEAARVAAEVAE